MKWMLVPYWTLNGQPVLTHTVFDGNAACENPIEALTKMIEYLGHDHGMAQCQQAKTT